MDILKPRNRGEKWVLYVGKRASGKYWPLILILGAILFGVLWYLQVLQTKLDLSLPQIVTDEAFSPLTTDIAMITATAVFSSLSVCIAIMFFERRHFYQIIERQREYIKDQLNDEQNEEKQ
jgi:lipid-A-disaccharide synthase-like uncharacterized protein